MKDTEARAREFDSDHGCGSLGRCLTCMADFAQREGISAVREFIEKVEAETGDKVHVLHDVFKEMFGEEL